jgi:hypothetical protein
MSDIADKIYAATGLTLNAEAAAAIGRLIQAENEKLREAICEWAASIYGYEGVLFLEGLKHEEFINSILDAERDRVEGGEKE